MFIDYIYIYGVRLPFFITMTCDPLWPKIQSQRLPGQNSTDAPVVVCRVFKRKLALLEEALRSMFSNAGGVLYLIHDAEFQKRGLPHAPIQEACTSLVCQYMLHNHPPLDKPPSSYCQNVTPNGARECRFNYPFPLTDFTTISDNVQVLY